MVEEARENDAGTAIVVEFLRADETAFDISGASTMTIKLQAPSGTVTTHTAALYTDGTDGKFYFTTSTATLDETGEWLGQGFVVLSSGQWHNKYKPFRVTGVLS